MPDNSDRRKAEKENYGGFMYQQSGPKPGDTLDEATRKLILSAPVMGGAVSRMPGPNEHAFTSEMPAGGLLGAAARSGTLAKFMRERSGAVSSIRDDIQSLVETAMKKFQEGNHSFAVEALDLLNKAFASITEENTMLREDRAHLRGENQRLREINLRMQEQILKRLEDVE